MSNLLVCLQPAVQAQGHSPVRGDESVPGFRKQPPIGGVDCTARDSAPALRTCLPPDHDLGLASEDRRDQFDGQASRDCSLLRVWFAKDDERPDGRTVQRGPDEFGFDSGARVSEGRRRRPRCGYDIISVDFAWEDPQPIAFDARGAAGEAGWNQVPTMAGVPGGRDLAGFESDREWRI